MLTDGGWLPGGTFRHLLAFDSVQVEKLLRAEALRLLVARGKISEDVVEGLLTWRHPQYDWGHSSGLSAHRSSGGKTLRGHSPRPLRGIRCPLVLERLEWAETSGEVIYRARPDARGESVARWDVSPALLGDVLEFLARVLDHLRDPNQQQLHCWGWYSNAARGRRERHQGEASFTRRASIDPADGESRQRRLTWLWPRSYWGSQLIREVYDIDPLLCPYCGASMRIAVPPVVSGVAFLIDFASLRRLQLGFY